MKVKSAYTIKFEIRSVEYEVLEILYLMQQLKYDDFIWFNRDYSNEHRKIDKKYNRRKK